MYATVFTTIIHIGDPVFIKHRVEYVEQNISISIFSLNCESRQLWFLNKLVFVCFHFAAFCGLNFMDIARSSDSV